MLHVTPLYAGLLALLFIRLSLNVVRGRYLHKVSVGDGGERDMIKRIRTQSNFVEYAPLALLLMAFAELQGLPFWLLHVVGLALFAGRVLHAIGFGSTPQIVPLRQIGMFLTFVVIAILALANILLIFL